MCRGHDAPVAFCAINPGPKQRLHHRLSLPVTVKMSNAKALTQISVIAENHLFGLCVLAAPQNVPLLNHSKGLWTKGTQLVREEEEKGATALKKNKTKKKGNEVHTQEVIPK